MPALPMFGNGQIVTCCLRNRLRHGFEVKVLKSRLFDDGQIKYLVQNKDYELQKLSRAKNPIGSPLKPFWVTENQLIASESRPQLKFSYGEKVLCYDVSIDCWCDAEILECNFGEDVTYLISYVKQSYNETVREERLLKFCDEDKMDKTKQVFKIGEKAICKQKLFWYKATILDCQYFEDNDEKKYFKYSVTYFKRRKCWDDWVSEEQLLKITEDTLDTKRAVGFKFKKEDCTRVKDSDSQPSRKKIRRRPRKIKKMDTNNNSETQLVPSHIQGMKRARPEYKDQDEETNEEPKNKRRSIDSGIESDNVSSTEADVNIDIPVEQQSIHDEDNFLVEMGVTNIIEYIDPCVKSDDALTKTYFNITEELLSMLDNELPVINLSVSEIIEYLEKS